MKFVRGAFLILLAAACNDSHRARRDDAPAARETAPSPESTPPRSTEASATSEPFRDDDGVPEPVVTPYRRYDINHVVSTGQSNSVAHEGRPVLTTEQPFSNLMFDVGVMTSGDCEREGCRTYQKPASLVPLVEGDTFWYPVETMSSGFANEAARLAADQYGEPMHTMLVSLAGRNGLTYWCLRRGGCNFVDPTFLNAFDESMKQVDDALAIARAAGKSYVVRAATAIHGESDDYAYATNTQEFPLDGTDGAAHSIANYTDALLEWQRDYEDGVRARTGQTEPVPLLISQHSGWNDIATSAVAPMQYEAHVRSKGKVVLVAAGYPLEYASDCRHYTNDSERRLGEYFAKAYARIVLAGRPWEPVHPKSVSRSGDVVRARFYVPAAPLVLDTTRVTDPGSYGFELVDGANQPIPIEKIALAGPDVVELTPTSGRVPARLRYAMTAVPKTCPGPTQGPRGNLRDSDDAPSQYGYDLFNWAVHFDVAID